MPGPPAVPPKPSPRLDTATIVEVSLAIADADGLEALTMRRLGRQLGVTPMAVYHHVANKGELLDLMADESLQALPPIDQEADWRAALREIFVGFHRLYLAHPALAEVMAQRPLSGPRSIRLAESILVVLADAGFTDEDAAATLVSLVNYTVGWSLYRVSRARQDGVDRERFDERRQDLAPRTYALRDHIDAAVTGEEQFVDGLVRLIAAYGAGMP